MKGLAPELSGVLKIGVNQQKGKKICAKRETRSLTTRELALISQSRGARGISETKKDGYYIVRGTDSAGNRTASILTMKVTSAQ